MYIYIHILIFSFFSHSEISLVVTPNIELTKKVVGQKVSNNCKPSCHRILDGDKTLF